VRAAGAVLWRPAGDGVEVAVVHRPRYDDWSFPKGKLDAGETVPDAAVREVAEETGFDAVLGRHLVQVSYPLPRNGALKQVDYFTARVRQGAFTAGDEVDQLRWLSPQEAAGLLTYDVDRQVLDSFTALPAATRTLLLVRHAHAGKRSAWKGDDDLRPLSAKGWRQAKALRRLLPRFGAEHVHAAPRVRCVQTVQDLADDLKVPVHPEPLLSEEGFWPDPEAGVARLLEIAAQPGTRVVCSQGGVIPHVVHALAVAGGLDVRRLTEDGTAEGTVPSKKGSLWVLSFAPESDDAESGPPRLVAADYLATALP